ncbi:hypothetical protein KAR91_10765 [Candidatus Pacearchaeota archaeon]|nr:hypothetical protein [Candidatus Pacearchaeota archaeon]
MTIENFNTYTEVDPNNHINTTSSRATATNINGGEVAYLYKDKGVGAINGDFNHTFETLVSASSNNNNQPAFWALANLLNDQKSIQDASGDELAVNLVDVTGAATPTFYLREIDGGTLYQDFGTVDSLVLRYLTIIRDESVGANGTLYLYIYSDSLRTILLDTLSIALHTSKKDFRYLYGIQSRDLGSAIRITSGYIQNLDLGLIAAAAGRRRRMLIGRN